MIILYVLLAVVVLLFMVLVHELGHYVAGRILKFKIDEFSVGFGKAIFSHTNKRGEKISLRIFPLGGYCAFAGESDDGTVDPNNKEAFTNQKPWKRIIVFLAGVTFNFLTAILFSLILLVSVGYDVPVVQKYQSMDDLISSSISVKGNPNGQELLEGDVIFAIDGQKIDFAYGMNYNDIITEKFNKMKIWIAENQNKPDVTFEDYPTINFSVRRNGEMIDVPVAIYQVKEIETDKEGNPIVGEDEKTKIKTYYTFRLTCQAYVHSFGEALARCVPFAFGLAWVVLKSLWMLITFQLSISSIGGPITTIATMAGSMQQSLSSVFVLIPLISANLAVFNLLPIPALDGAHVVFTSVEWIRGKPIDRKIENMIHSIGLMVLFGFVVIVDILHFVL